MKKNRKALLDCVEQLSEAKARVEDRVKMVRGLLRDGELDADQQREIRGAYDDARAEVNSGLDRVVTGVTLGGPDEPDEAYQALTVRAEAHMLKFLKASGDVIAGPDRGLLDTALKAVGTLATALLEVWKGMRGETKEQRVALAAKLEAMKWLPFDAII